MQPVFQDPFAALNPRMKVLDIVTEPFVIHGREAGIAGGRTDLRNRAAKAARGYAGAACRRCLNFAGFRLNSTAGLKACRWAEV